MKVGLAAFEEKWNNSSLIKLLVALLLNAVFLAFTALIVSVGFESNDDLTLAAFVDGQMANADAHIPYINYVLGLLLKAVYDVLGRGVAWHAIGQYALIYLSFSAISFVLFRRLRHWQAAVVSIVLLLFFGVDVYTIISYTKTAAVCAVGGTLLMVYALDSLEKGRRAPCIVAGGVLCVFGFMLRPLEFLPCFAIVAVLCLRWLYGLLFLEKGSVKEKSRRLVSFALPFVMLILVCAGLYAVDEAAWSQGEWKYYHDYDAVRVAYSDYGRPEYEEMPEAYDALGISPAAVQLLYEGNYFDTEYFTAELMESISRARDENFPPLSVGECLGVFLEQCLMGFFRNLHVYGFLFIAAFWLCGSEHKLRDWLSLAGSAGLFALFYLYLIYRGRYLIDRVDVGLFLAVAAVLCYMLDKQRFGREKVLVIVALVGAVGVSYYLNRDRYRSNVSYKNTEDRAVVDMLLEDEEHLFLAKLDTVSDRVYSPFEPASPGHWDKIVLMGGFDPNHPVIMENLAKYGVSNPYRDIVGNDKVYMIEDNIDLTLEYIHERYDPDASAELVEPLSSQTGLEIYRILD